MIERGVSRCDVVLRAHLSSRLAPKRSTTNSVTSKNNDDNDNDTDDGQDKTKKPIKSTTTTIVDETTEDVAAYLLRAEHYTVIDNSQILSSFCSQF